MAGFKFPLSRLLDMRRETVESIERQIEERNAQREKLREILYQQRDFYFEDRNHYNDHLRSGKVDQLGIYEQSMELRKERMKEILTAIREIQEDIDILQQSRVAAKRDVKVVENLKDKRYSEYLRNEEAAERKMLDEQATLRHLRREQAERLEEKG